LASGVTSSISGGNVASLEAGGGLRLGALVGLEVKGSISTIRRNGRYFTN
jgi:hypothetical protein